LPTPEPGYGRVRLRVQSLSLNRADLLWLADTYVESPELPSRIGYEVAGLIEAIGPDVSAWKVGDRVSASPAFSIKDYANFAETALLPERVLLADTRQFYGGSSFRVQLRLLHRLRSVGIRWAGQFEYLQAAEKRLAVLIPFTLLITFVLIYMNTRSVTKTLIVLLAVPFSLVGAFWTLYLLGYNMSVAVWVGSYCAGRTRCGDWRRDVALPRSRLGKISCGRPHELDERPLRRSQGRRRPAHPAQDHDNLRDSFWPAAHHVVTHLAGGLLHPRGRDPAKASGPSTC
jgi:hypothetical protein